MKRLPAASAATSDALNCVPGATETRQAYEAVGQPDGINLNTSLLAPLVSSATKTSPAPSTATALGAAPREDSSVLAQPRLWQEGGNDSKLLPPVFATRRLPAPSTAKRPGFNSEWTSRSVIGGPPPAGTCSTSS